MVVAWWCSNVKSRIFGAGLGEVILRCYRQVMVPRVHGCQQQIQMQHARRLCKDVAEHLLRRIAVKALERNNKQARKAMVPRVHGGRR